MCWMLGLGIGNWWASSLQTQPFPPRPVYWIARNPTGQSAHAPGALASDVVMALGTGSSTRIRPRRRTASNSLEFDPQNAIRRPEWDDSKPLPTRPPARLPTSTQPAPAPAPAAYSMQSTQSMAMCLARTQGETVCMCRQGATSDGNAFLCHTDPNNQARSLCPYPSLPRLSKISSFSKAYTLCNLASYFALPPPRMKRSPAQRLLSWADMVLQASAVQRW